MKLSCAVVPVSRYTVLLYSRMQKSTALSFKEVDDLEMATGRRETSFMRYLWSFIFMNQDVGCATVNEDTPGAIHLAKTTVKTPNSEHIDVRHHFVRDRASS